MISYLETNSKYYFHFFHSNYFFYDFTFAVFCDKLDISFDFISNVDCNSKLLFQKK